jgi:HAD superfamily hydrolase (TIGR01509 family)
LWRSAEPWPAGEIGRCWMRVRAVLFDMDGTIYDSGIDFLEIRRRIGVSDLARPILTQLDGAEPDVRARGIAILHEAERAGAENGSLVPGARELIDLLHERGVLCALITNNSRQSVERVLRRHPLSFDLVRTREDGVPKPEPDLFLAALNGLGVAPHEAVAVGDAHLDVLAAHRAGIREVVLVGSPDWMKRQIPLEVTYRLANDLVGVREILKRLLSADWREAD